MAWHPNFTVIYVSHTSISRSLHTQNNKRFINGRLDSKRAKKIDAKLPEISEHCSKRERVAEEAERETDNLKNVNIC